MRRILHLILVLAPVALAACGGGGGGTNYDASGKLVEFTTAPGLPGAATGQLYSLTLSAKFPNPPGNYYVTDGALPPGLALHEDDGEITGYPRQVGTFKFEVAARDGAEGKLPEGRDVTYAEDRQQFTMEIARGPVQILPQTLPTAQYRGSYGHQIDVAGGTPPYTFQKSAGLLPAGLTVSPSGFLGAFPTEALFHPYVFDVTVTDALGGQHTRTFELDVVVLPLVIETFSLPDASEGFPYDTPLTLASPGGGPPYTWKQEAPAPGETALATINMGVSADGHVKSLSDAGPPAAGNFTFTVSVTDEAQQKATRAYTLHVRSSPVLYSITPRYANQPGPFTAKGVKFLPGAQLVTNPGTPAAQTITPTYVDGTTLTFATAPPSSIKGPVTVRILNPDGGFYDRPAALLYPANNISFGTKGFLDSAVSSFGLDAGDLNGDGLAEVVHAGASGFKPFSSYALTSSAGGLDYFRNDGGLTFTRTTLDPGNFTDVKLIDVDVDGDLDVVALGTTVVKSWINNGAGVLTPGPVTSLPALSISGAFTSEMAVGHFNADTIPDLAYATGSRVLGGAVYTMVGTGNGGFASVAAATSGMSSSFYGVNSLACDRVNADTVWDVVAGVSYYSSATPQLRMSMLNSGGTFGAWSTAGNNTSSWGGTSAVRRGNFLGNAPPCLVVGTVQDPPDSGGVGGNQLTICSGASLATKTALSITAGMVKSIGIGDFDFDGIDDFAVSHKVATAGTVNPPLTGSPDRVMVYKGATGALMATLSLKTGTPTVTNAQSGRVASGDLDGDGRPDLLVTTSFWATDNQQSTTFQRGDSADGTPLGIVYYLNTSQ